MSRRVSTSFLLTSDTLIAALTEKVKDNLYVAILDMGENILLLNHIGDHYAMVIQLGLAAVYFNKAKEAEERSGLMRKAVYSHEQLTKHLVKSCRKRIIIYNTYQFIDFKRSLLFTI